MNAEILARHRNNVFAIDVKTYPGGEPLITHQGAVDAILVRPMSMLTFMAAMFWQEAMCARGKPIETLYLPYIPGARQDRLNDDGDQLFTLKSVARMINAANFDQVVVLDPHSDVATALIDRCTVMNYKLRPTVAYDFVIAPDAGASKRAEKLAKHLHVPVLQAWKTRDTATGKISGFGITPPEKLNSRALVVDDICDGGGTFIGLADVLAKYGVVADLYVSHGIFSKGTEPLLKWFRKVFCTDSVLADQTGAEVNPVCFDVFRTTRKDW